MEADTGDGAIVYRLLHVIDVAPVDLDERGDLVMRLTMGTGGRATPREIGQHLLLVPARAFTAGAGVVTTGKDMELSTSASGSVSKLGPAFPLHPCKA
jgi:hypothetical protein